MKTLNDSNSVVMVININATYNNTIINVTDFKGNVTFISSAGMVGFKGARRSSSFAAGAVAQKICTYLKQIKFDEIIVKIKGLGNGRESAMRTLIKYKLPIKTILDVTPRPHNGCRPCKQRRI
uniref:30S ribosomal protein S11 n=1 Tax=Palpitomonas bilix TaxID=652834 RepID=A0A1E1GHS6_9EUKA|nr:30S ribosomal protein S11 [Palpitomonas bilix]BAV82420.1 30S ribosomal protein S11 [Palpitomonas bilix]